MLLPTAVMMRRGPPGDPITNNRDQLEQVQRRWKTVGAGDRDLPTRQLPGRKEAAAPLVEAEPDAAAAFRAASETTPAAVITQWL